MINNSWAGLGFRAMRFIDLPFVMKNEKAAYSHPWSEGNFRTSLKANDSCQLLQLDGVTVGHGILSAGAGEAHVLNLCVHPDYQGQGLGKALLEHLIGEAKHRRARSLFLEVRASNHVAAALYAGLGFNEIGRRPGYYPLDGRRREDALVMGKKLF